MALATIVIPSFNHSAYVGQSIESVLSQDHPEIELLIIDDGSSDDSVELIQSYVDQCRSTFKRFEFRSRENLGLAKTLNEALAWATGEYFSMLSSDDTLSTNKTSYLINYLESHKEISGVFGGINQTDITGNVTRVFNPAPGTWDFQDVLEKKCKLFAPAMLIRTEALRSVGGYWEDIALEDRSITLKLAFADHKLATVSKPLANYRWHESNTIKQTKKMTDARLKMLEKFPEKKEIKSAKAKVLHGAAREYAAVNINAAWQSYWRAIEIDVFSIFSKAAYRALKKMLWNSIPFRKKPSIK